MASIVVTFAFAVSLIGRGALAALACDVLDLCSCRMSDGSGLISLWGIDDGSTIRFPHIKDASSAEYYYGFSPCTRFSNGMCKDVVGCQFFDTQRIDIASSGFETVVDASGNVTFKYHSPQSTIPQRTMAVSLKCEASATIPHTSAVTEGPEYTYSMALYTHCACIGACKQASNRGGPDKHISLGSVLCIVLLVIVVVYLAVGIVVNKYAKGKQGSEIIPNKAFWSDLPVLVKDGVVFSYGRLRGSDGHYEELK